MGLAPPLVALAFASQRARQRRDFTAVRQAADAIHAFICGALDGTRLYVVETRSALLGRDSERMLAKRLAQEPRAALQAQAEAFFRPNDAAALTPAERQEVRRIAEPSDPEGWVRKLMARGLLAQGGGPAWWEVEVRAAESVSGVDVDPAVAFDASILVASDWLAATTKVVLPPLSWRREPVPPPDPPLSR